MRVVGADLLDDVVSSYDKTKTTIYGRCFSKTVDGKTALGPPLNKFADVQSDTGFTMLASNMVMTDNGRIFIFSSEAGTSQLALYTINFSTGATSYVGKIAVTMPDVAATTTAYRAVKAIDTGTTGWKIFLVTTGSVLINGGPLLINNIALADFTPVGFPTIPFATGNDQKAVYKLEDPAFTGAGNLNTASAGAVLDKANNRLYVHNGVAATHQYFVFNTSTAPTWTSFSVTGSQATDIISCAGHPYVNGDPITFSALNGGAGLTALNTYFVVNAVAGVSFQVAVTTGGSAINFTTDITSGTVGRAFGTSHSLFLHKTGNLPALTGTLLLTDSEDFALPQHTSNAGQRCAFFCTNSAIYLGQLSELTAGTTTWPSLVTANLLGAPGLIVTPVATNAAWSNALDRAVVSTGNVFIMKRVFNNEFDRVFGGQSNKILEGFSYEAIELQPTVPVTAMDLENGWIGIVNLAAGQRGVILSDLQSDSFFDYSYLVTKVMDSPASVLKFITTVDALYDYTGSLEVYYRTTDFDDVPDTYAGWTSIPFAELLDAYASGEQIQFKVMFATLGLDTSIPAQLCDFFLGYDKKTDSSEHWELSVDRSDNGNPSKAVFRLKKAYASAVPDLNFIATDLTNVQILSHTTSANAARFEYSTDAGLTYSPLGTIPNTVGTLVKYEFATPPGVDVRPSMREA